MPRCEVCFPLEDAIKLYDGGKSYSRGKVDYAVRIPAPYPMTDAQRAILVPPELLAEPKKKAKRQPVSVAPGIEVPLDMVVKRTKTGAINTQSTLGKVVALALDAGCELKAGRSEAVAWIQGAHHGLRFSVCGTTVVVNGRVVPKEELFVRLEELAN